MGRKSIHPYKHLKGLEELRVLKLCRRISKELLPILFHYHEHFVIIFRLLQERGYICFSHPAAEDIIVLLIVSFFQPRCHLPDIKVIGEFLQPLLCSQQLGGMASHQFLDLLIYCIDLLIRAVDILLQAFASQRGCPDIFAGNGYPLKVKGIEHGIHSARLRIRHKIASIDKILVSDSLQKYGIEILKQIFLQLPIIINADPSEPYLHIPVSECLMKIQFQRSERLQYV